MPKITSSMLRAKNACKEETAIFESEWPDGLEVTEAVADRVIELGLSVGWVVENFLTAPARAEYNRVMAPACAEYERVTAPARAEYNRVMAPALAEYNRVKAPALAEYNRVTAPALAEYERVTAPARAVYNRVKVRTAIRLYIEHEKQNGI